MRKPQNSDSSRTEASVVLSRVHFAHSSPLVTRRERSLQLPRPLEACRIGVLEKPSPSRVEILHAGIAVFRAPSRPVRHRHRNGDTPLPRPLLVTLVPNRMRPIKWPS